MNLAPAVMKKVMENVAEKAKAKAAAVAVADNVVGTTCLPTRP